MSTYHLVVTNCTARKRSAEDSLQFSEDLVDDTLKGTVHRWRAALAKHGPRLRAADMYLGRSMIDARQVATTLDAHLYIASAGWGLVKADKYVAPYDLTVSDPRGRLQEVLRSLETTSCQWWRLLCRGRGISHLLAENPRATLLVALPASYLEMVGHDLCNGNVAGLNRVRLFTSLAGADQIPAGMAKIVMPYDERLESIAGYAGTRADFPQRAMRHFVEQLGASGLGQALARTSVLEALSSHELRHSVKRKRADDIAIKALIRQQWKTTGGRGSVLLRYLRDEARIACEQRRFAGLWRDVRAEKLE